MVMGQQTCKVCGHRDKFDFTVPDEVWALVVPEEYQNRVACLACFDDFAARSNIDYAHSLEVLYFAGQQATFVFRPMVAIDRKDYQE